MSNTNGICSRCHGKWSNAPQIDWAAPDESGFPYNIARYKEEEWPEYLETLKVFYTTRITFK